MVNNAHLGTVQSVGRLCFQKQTDPKNTAPHSSPKVAEYNNKHLSKLGLLCTNLNFRDPWYHKVKVKLLNGSFILRFHFKISEKCTSLLDRDYDYYLLLI